MILHVREANRDAIDIMKEENVDPAFPIHLHAFKSRWHVCKWWMESFPGVRFGITPTDVPEEALKQLPLDKILLETDAPYFLPKGVSNTFPA